jgi:pantothenate kinase
MAQVTLTFEQALSRGRSLLNNANERTIIGIVGKPGAGKSTLTTYLKKNLPTELVAFVPMDGYHLSNKVLEKLGRRDRKGAPDTFDSHGYAALLQRIATSTDEVYFPEFHREIEESIAAEGVVNAKTKLIFTEGNYLLHNQDGWEKVAPLLNETWYVDVDDATRLERLVNRHHFFGKDRQAAHDWAHGTDENNARLVERAKDLADCLVINAEQ